jgi:hypothetical protein
MADTSSRSTARADRYEVRAVWKDSTDAMVSQSVEQFDLQPMLERGPDLFGVYVVYGGHVEDHATRAKAETHADQLNGGDRS